MFEMMSELEAVCARLGARRMTAPEREQLRAVHLACEAASVSVRLGRLLLYKNEAFHHAIYGGSHNAFLIEQALALSRRLRPYRRLQLRVRDRVPASFAEHGALVDAIVGRRRRAGGAARARPRDDPGRTLFGFDGVACRRWAA